METTRGRECAATLLSVVYKPRTANEHIHDQIISVAKSLIIPIRFYNFLATEK